jgi:hypothetical protein
MIVAALVDTNIMVYRFDSASPQKQAALTALPPVFKYSKVAPKLRNLLE